MSQPVYRGTVNVVNIKPCLTNPEWFYATFAIPEIGLRLEDVLIRHEWRGTSTYKLERPAVINFDTRNEGDTFWDECLSKALNTGLLCNARPVNGQLALLDIESRRYPD